MQTPPRGTVCSSVLVNLSMYTVCSAGSYDWSCLRQINMSCLTFSFALGLFASGVADGCGVCLVLYSCFHPQM